MTKIQPKTTRVKLDPKGYADLHRQVLERDNWRCKMCGSMRNLEVHHIQFRSHFGADVEHNLLTLCTTCHGESHRRRKL